MAKDADDLGFVLDEDQTDKPEPIAEDWQTAYLRNLRESWLQGHGAQKNYPDMSVEKNPYIGRGDDIVALTRALGWESGFVAAENGQGEDECPYPEG